MPRVFAVRGPFARSDFPSMRHLNESALRLVATDNGVG